MEKSDSHLTEMQKAAAVPYVRRIEYLREQGASAQELGEEIAKDAEQLATMSSLFPVDEYSASANGQAFALLNNELNNSQMNQQNEKHKSGFGFKNILGLIVITTGAAEMLLTKDVQYAPILGGLLMLAGSYLQLPNRKRRSR